MRVINQSYSLETPHDLIKHLPISIESAARTCYKSEGKIGPGSAEDLCKKLIKRQHYAMLEHGDITVRFITDRGVSHEMVRHRHCSFAQESTRYVKYNDIEFIRPEFPWGDSSELEWDNETRKGWANGKAGVWLRAMMALERAYKELIDLGASPQEARSVLPNSVKTEIVMKTNVRDWRHFFQLRTDKAAHPQIRALTIPLLEELKEIVPVLFEDIEVK